MKYLLPAAVALATSALTLTTATQLAHAITCAGNVQVNKNSRIITPYCEHEQMAKVARSFGVRTTGKRLRNNVNHKRQVCEFIGHDVRLSSVCGGLRLEDRGGRYAS